MIQTKIGGLGFVPIEVRRAFAQTTDPKPGEETLWREVIARMVLDALGITGMQSSLYEHNTLVRDARIWWSPRGDTDRKLSFDLASIENMELISESMNRTTPIPLEQQKRKRQKGNLDG